MYWNDDFRLVSDLTQPLVLDRPLYGSASIGLIAVPLMDVVRACIAIAKYDTLTLIFHGQPARHFPDMHFAYSTTASLRSDRDGLLYTLEGSFE